MRGKLELKCMVAALAVVGLVACTSESDSGGNAPIPASAPVEAAAEVVAEPEGEPREVAGEMLAYAEVDDDVVHGYFVIPVDMINPLPAVIVVHDWWGLNDSMRELSERLAAEGFIVLGVDMFDGKVASVAPDARKLEIEVIEQPELLQANLDQAVDFLLDVANAPNVAVLGFGSGGSWALNAAVDQGERLSSVASFYGQVRNDKDWLANLNRPLLGLFAENDRAVPANSVAAFSELLEELGKSHEIEVLPGVRRGFADRLSDNYDAEAAAESWRRLVTFLNATLSGPAGN